MGKKSPLFGTLENLEARITLSASPLVTDATLIDPLLNQAASQAAQATQVGQLNNTGAVGATAAATATPYGGTAVVIPTSGKVVIEAENYDQGGEGIAYHDNDASNMGGAYRTSDGVDVEVCAEGGYDVGWVRTGEWSAYSIKVQQSGTYTVTARVASSFATSKFHLEFGPIGQTSGTGIYATQVVNLGNTGGVQNYIDITFDVQLNAGDSWMRFVADDNYMNVNKFTIAATGTNHATAVPANGTTSINAVDFDKGGQNIGYYDKDIANLGGQYRTSEGVDIQKCSESGYNIYSVSSGEWTAYTLSVEKSGTYDVTLRVAANVSSKLHLEVFQNGVWTKLSSVTFASTGGTQKWADLKISGVSLKSGFATMRVVADSDGYSLCKVSLTKTADPVVKNFTTSVTTMSGYQRLTINGTADNDNITISKSNGVLTVTNGDYSETFTGNYGDIVIHGGDGNDVITVQASVNIATLLYGDAGNDTLTALGTGANIITSIGGGNDVLTGNGINTSFWADEAATDTINASSAEIAAGRVHRVANFYQPWTTSTTSSDYVSKDLLGQNLRDPAGTGTTRYSSASLWGTGPSVYDINQGQTADCYLLADLQSAAQTTPDKLKETVVDLGDGTYAVQFKRNGQTTYVRVDGDFGGNGLYINKSTSGVWAMAIEKAYALFRTGANSYSSLDYGDTGAAARDLGYTVSYLSTISQTANSLATAVQSAIASGIGLTVSTGSTIKSGAPVASSHAYTLVGTTTSNTGEILFQLRNPWGFDGYGSDGNASDGIVTLTFAQMQANFSTIMKMV